MNIAIGYKNYVESGLNELQRDLQRAYNNFNNAPANDVDRWIYEIKAIEEHIHSTIKLYNNGG